MSIRIPTYLVGTKTGKVQDHSVVITPATTSGEGNEIKKLNYRFDKGGEPVNLFGKLTAGAAIEVYVYPYPGDTTTKHLEVTVSVSSPSYNPDTGTFVEVLNGSFWAIEGVKVGASGEASMIGYI